MDSRSGPEVPSKVHGFGEAVKGCCGRRVKSERLRFSAWGIAATLLAACAPDLDDPEGVLALLAQGCASHGSEALFPAVDERSRFALDAIAGARQKARSLINAHYPEEARAEALLRLADDGDVQNGAELFARRCTRECRSRLCDKVGAVASVTAADGLTKVRTVRGGEYVLYRTAQRRYGVVFDTDALSRERKRAFAELSSIQANSKVYARQQTLR